MNQFLDAQDALWEAFYTSDPSLRNDHFNEFRIYMYHRFQDQNALVAFGSSNMINNCVRLREALTHCPIFANDEEAGKGYLRLLFEDSEHPVHQTFLAMMLKYRAYKVQMTGDTDESESDIDSD